MRTIRTEQEIVLYNDFGVASYLKCPCSCLKINIDEFVFEECLDSGLCFSEVQQMLVDPAA